MPSSVVTSSSVSARSSSLTATGMISRSKRPSAVARAARWWQRTENSSSCLAADAPLLGDQLGTLALADQPAALGVAAHIARPERVPELADDRRPHRGAGHDLDPAADHHVVGPGDDALGGEVQGLLGRPALPVDGGGGHRLGEAGGQDGVAPDVEGLLARPA